MRNSWKLGLGAAVLTSVAFVGCSSGGDSGGDGSGGTSAGAGKAGGGSGGLSIGGTSAGMGGSHAGTAGTAGAGGSHAGNGGQGGAAGGAGGAGGKAGSGGMGGASAGASGGGAGGASAGASGGGAGGTAGTAGSGGSGGACVDGDNFGSEGGAGGFETAIVLIDNVTIKDNTAAVKKTWAFADATDILDDKVGNVGDKWVRLPFDMGNIGYSSADSHDVFSKCDGKPAGSLKAVVPFTAAGQYYELGIGFAEQKWTKYTVTADAKLVSGGNPQPDCPGHAELFANGSGGPTTGPSVLLKEGTWVSLTLTSPDTETSFDHLAVRITSYTCQ